MIRKFLATVLVIFASFGMAQAQQQPAAAPDLAWVQIEAKPNLADVNAALRRRAAELSDVNGFNLSSSGWYVVALGPYDAETADYVLRTLRGEGRIPRDSYITDSADYRRQIWPVGTDHLARRPAPANDLGAALNRADDTLREPAPNSAPGPTDETPRDARASEALLSQDQRASVQIALEWAGHYEGRVDAQFGAGTRQSMARWQMANGHEPTGILTTRQRAELLNAYNAVLDGLGLAVVADPKMGIEMKVPLGAVEFTRYEPPFAHFDATGDIPAQVLLISQEGTQDTLHSLYEIMQTLEIVPQNGPRERSRDSFTLTGQNARIVSYTEARLENGQIKGFTLVWPVGDEERRTRLLHVMQNSFVRTAGVLDPSESDNSTQRIDLVAGLDIRKPKYTRSGFYVDDRGMVLTTAELATGCGHVTIEDGQEADIAATDKALGVSILRPRGTVAPLGVASLRHEAPLLQSEVTLAGYSYGGVLGAPSLTVGTVSDIRGLNGEAGISRLAIDAREADAGGPVMDPEGEVVGMLLPRDTDGRTMPENVALAAGGDALSRMLTKAGAAPVQATPSRRPLAPAQMSERATDMTVLVSCWE
ncbi:MAG: serine protease [Rhodobacterales bacterium]|nr:serine protease [Rhodobacterales bacterium]